MDREDLTAIGVILSVMTTIGAVIIALANWGQSVQCKQQAELMGLEHRYSFNTTCNVKVDGRWEPLSWQRSVRIKNAD